MSRVRRGGLLALLLVTVTVATAAGRSLEITDFASEVEVKADGTILVTERISARFTGSWNGLYRTIPVEYRTPQGFTFKLRLGSETATDPAGAPLRVEASRERHYRKLKVWIPGAVDATRTIVLRYRVRNALRFFDDHDELYWNVTGDEWDVPVGRATARITLPGAASAARATAFTGGYGSRERDAEVVVDGPMVDVWMRRPLAFREGLTVVVGWAKGAVQPPSTLAAGGDFLRDNWPLGLPVIALALMGRLWWTRGRDPRLRPIAVRYEPPAGLSPAEVGALADEKVDVRDITATLVDLAVHGHLTIEETGESGLFGLWTSTSYAFNRLTPVIASDGLKPHERALIAGIFTGADDRVQLVDLENKFYRHLEAIRRGIYDALVTRGLYAERPDKVRTRWTVAAIVVAALGVAAALPGANLIGASPLALGIGGLGSAAAVLVFGRLMPARSIAGTRALEEVRGFEEFLTRVEADRLERLPRTPELFEKYLPFAMALGVERQWARAFEGITRESPRWYHGPSGSDFRPNLFADRMGGMSRATAAAMVSQPRSTSSGSGFSGGSSGGGFGGGGGGGF